MIHAYQQKAINRLCASLRKSLGRCDPPLADSLRLMAVQVVKEGLARGLQGHPAIHPGMSKMAHWGNCSERQARRNVRTLEAWEVMTPVLARKGGNLATRYRVDPDALLRAMMIMRANPNPSLITEIRDLRDLAQASFQGGHLSGHVSAGIFNSRARAMSHPTLQNETSQDPYHEKGQLDG